MPFLVPINTDAIIFTKFVEVFRGWLAETHSNDGSKAGRQGQEGVKLQRGYHQDEHRYSLPFDYILLVRFGFPTQSFLFANMDICI